MAQQIIDVGTGANSGNGDPNRTAWVKANDNFTELYNGSILNNRIVVTQVNVTTTLGGTIDSTKEYFLDGVIDMGTTQIDLSGGKDLNIRGYDFSISGLTSSENSYTMITGADAGNVLWFDFKIEVTGTGSKVLDITDGTGLHAFEISRINFNSCTSLGTLNGYRQGLETGTGRFGGTPELTLAGTWLGGYYIDISIVRSLTDGSYTLFKAGASFTMASRFRTNMNVDLNTTVSLFDFVLGNFTNGNTLIIQNALITRNGVIDASDTTIAPNVTRKEICSLWTDNVGIRDTNVGGKIRITTEAATTLTSNVWSLISGTFTLSSAEHFDSPSSGELRHLGANPIDFNLAIQTVFSGSSGNDIEIRIQRWNDSSSAWVSFTELYPKRISVGGGGSNVAEFVSFSNVLLEENDKIRIQVRNTSASNSVTLLSQSYLRVNRV